MNHNFAPLNQAITAAAFADTVAPLGDVNAEGFKDALTKTASETYNHQEKAASEVREARKGKAVKFLIDSELLKAPVA